MLKCVLHKGYKESETRKRVICLRVASYNCLYNFKVRDKEIQKIASVNIRVLC